jgi:membrane protein
MSRSLQSVVEKFLWEPPDGIIDSPARYLLGPARGFYALIRDIATGQLTLRAMSLVYTTLLSIVPLIAFSFSVLKGFGFHREVEPLLYEFFQPLGEKGAELTGRIIGFVDNVQGRLLGGIGLLLLVYTVISMVQKVEHSVNWIWQVSRPRTLARKFSDYLSVLLVGPILMLAAMGMIASISSHALVQQLTSVEPFGTSLVLAGKLMPMFLVSFVFTFVYVFIINTRVRLVAALIGGISAGVLWALTGKLFASFVVGSTKYAAIYSSFAILIIALIWIYMNWMILLLGAQIAYYVQHPENLRSGRRRIEVRGRRREALALDIMLRVARRFLEGPPYCEIEQLAQEMDMPLSAVSTVAYTLEEVGLLGHTEEGGLVPGRDIANVTLADILISVRRSSAGAMVLPPAQGAAEAVLDEVEHTIGRELGERTLREMVSEAPAEQVEGIAVAS